MRLRTITNFAAVAALTFSFGPALAESGSATGNGTSTPAGPAGKTDGGAATGSASSSKSMMKSSGGSMMKSGSTGTKTNGTSTIAGPAGKSAAPK